MKKNIFILLGLLIGGAAWSQEHHGHDANSGHQGQMSDHGTEQEQMNDRHSEHDMDHDMGHESEGNMDHDTGHIMNPMDHDTGNTSGHDRHESMGDPGLSTGLRDPHAFADGYDYGPLAPPHLGDTHLLAGMTIDRLELVRGDEINHSVYDLHAWIGRDYRRLLLRAEGEVDDSELEEATTVLVVSQAISPFWNLQYGVRHDSGTVPDRSWLAIGLEGLAPYWFEVDTAFYIGEQGRAILELAMEYELLLTQKLILQPSLEAEMRAGEDPEIQVGSGLAALTAGVRLRYEILREFAPYIGVEWSGRYGGTADFARQAGDDIVETRAVAGLRFWL